MKKLMILMFSSLLAICLVGAKYEVKAESYNWTDGLADFLETTLSDINSGTFFFTEFTLHDMDGDNVPELILKNSQIENTYNFYSFEDGEVEFDRSVNAAGFYEHTDGSFLVSYGDVAGTTYAVYDKNETISTSEKMFRTKRGEKNADDEWEMDYYYKGDKVEERVYNRIFEEEITEVSLNFLPVNSTNINHNVYFGAGNYMEARAPQFTFIEHVADLNMDVSFDNRKTVSVKEDGEDLIFALLSVNNEIMTEDFPLNINGTTYVPVRVVGENLNAEIEWEEEEKKVTIDGVSLIEMYINEDYALVDGAEVILDAVPTVIDGTTYVPLRFVSENLACDVYFNEGMGKFSPIVSIVSKHPLGVGVLDSYDALQKAEAIFENVEWPGVNVLSKGHMDGKLDIKETEELFMGRYHVISIDEEETQCLLIDKYTGAVMSKYSGTRDAGVALGADMVILSMLEKYSGVSE